MSGGHSELAAADVEVGSSEDVLVMRWGHRFTILRNKVLGGLPLFVGLLITVLVAILRTGREAPTALLLVAVVMAFPIGPLTMIWAVIGAGVRSGTVRVTDTAIRSANWIDPHINHRIWSEGDFALHRRTVKRSGILGVSYWEQRVFYRHGDRHYDVVVETEAGQRFLVGSRLTQAQARLIAERLARHLGLQDSPRHLVEGGSPRSVSMGPA